VQVLARYRDGKRGPHHLRAHPAPGSSRIRSADFWLGDSHDLSPRIRGRATTPWRQRGACPHGDSDRHNKRAPRFRPVQRWT
jgi:hypothetical protein